MQPMSPRSISEYISRSRSPLMTCLAVTTNHAEVSKFVSGSRSAPGKFLVSASSKLGSEVARKVRQNVHRLPSVVDPIDKIGHCNPSAAPSSFRFRQSQLAINAFEIYHGAIYLTMKGFVEAIKQIDASLSCLDIALHWRPVARFVLNIDLLLERSTKWTWTFT